ncbi:MAG TPA: hypothetical protein PKA64_13625 [Myxococcota bacterium]|nr:hypothetical protein [Myxococcota bacterium]
MLAVAWCSLPGEDPVPLGHGDLIGRASAAALVVEDARVSEAHGYVSLRGGRLRLLALRGRFRVGGHVTADVELSPGVDVELAEGLALHVHRVELPSVLVGVEGPDLPRQALPGTVALDVRPAVRVRPGWHRDAAAVLWSVDDAWRVSRPGHPDRAVQPGDVIDLDGWPLAIVAIPLRDAGQRRTVVGIAAPLRIEARFHTVRVLSDDRTPVVIGGLHGRILSELIALDGPVDWRVVAREVWDDDDEGLRRRWDVTLSRLRARLRSLGLRDDLVHADGAGHVELLLRPGDTTALVDG